MKVVKVYGELKKRLGGKSQFKFDVRTPAEALRALCANFPGLESSNAVVIANPTSMHYEYAIKALKEKCHVYIEKPLSHNDKGLKDIDGLEIFPSKRNSVKTIPALSPPVNNSLNTGTGSKSLFNNVAGANVP